MTINSPPVNMTGVKEFEESNRVHLKVIAGYCAEVEQHTKKQHDLEKLIENLLQFGEVCGDVLYFSDVKNQLKKCSYFFRKRLLNQHIYVVEQIMTCLKQNGAIEDRTFFSSLAQELDEKNWENECTKSEKQTVTLRHKAERLYNNALPSYNACISKMYPEFKQGEDDSTRYRIIKVGVDDPPKEIKKQNHSSKKNSKRNVKDLEKKFEMRSRYVTTKRQPSLGPRRQNSRSRQSRGQRVRVGPTYSVSSSLPLTHENLNQHIRYVKEVGVQDRDPFGWPYDPFLFRETPFEGRRALSDGGFDVEHKSRVTGRALSDDGGPVYQGSEDLYSPATDFSSYEMDTFLTTPKFDSPKEESGYYCRFTPSPPPPQADDSVMTLTDNGFFGSTNVWRSVFTS